MNALPLVDVACGVVINAAGELLAAQRPPGKRAAGYWEFPGGKIEPGEAPELALARELAEELGLVIEAPEPLIDFTHVYSDRRVRLRTYRITRFAGDPQAREGQAFCWIRPDRLLRLTPQLPTVGPILAALRLPAHYAFTPALPDGRPWTALPRCQAPRGALVRLRQPQWSAAHYADQAPGWVAAMRAAGFVPVLDRAPELSRALGVGLHLPSRRLTKALGRPVAAASPCLASVHSQEELMAARRWAVDAVVIGPVAATPSHPEVVGLGWAGFADLARQAGRPAYALGGLTPADVPAAKAAFGQGIAAIRAYFGDSPSG